MIIGLFPHAGLEKFDPRFAGALGAVHCDFGFGQQFLGMLMRVLADCNANRACRVNLMPCNLDWLAQELTCLFGEGKRIVALRARRQEHCKCITVDPRHGVVDRYEGFEAARNGNQQRIAARMAETVVHSLEAVEVDEQQRGARPLEKAPAPDCPLHPVHKERPVRQAGQAVMHAVMQEPFFSKFLCRDITHSTDAPRCVVFRTRHTACIE